MRVMKKCNAPVEKWRVEVWIRHPAKVGMCPAKRIGEDRLIVDLRDSVMTSSIPGAWSLAQPEHQPKFRYPDNWKSTENKQRVKTPQARTDPTRELVFVSSIRGHGIGLSC